MTADVYRTVFTVEVFSQGPFGTNSLEEIAYAITEGDCIGDVTEESSEIVPRDKIMEHLIRIGNDGSFLPLLTGDPDDEQYPPHPTEGTP